jgi:hypothetical protein
MESGVYPQPWWGVTTSVRFQNLFGPRRSASYFATNAEIAPSLGRNLSGCPTRRPRKGPSSRPACPLTGSAQTASLSSCASTTSRPRQHALLDGGHPAAVTQPRTHAHSFISRGDALGRRESSARAPRPTATARRRRRKLPAQVGQPLCAGPRNQGIEPGVNQGRLLPYPVNSAARAIRASSRLRVVCICTEYISMQTGRLIVGTARLGARCPTAVRAAGDRTIVATGPPANRDLSFLLC